MKYKLLTNPIFIAGIIGFIVFITTCQAFLLEPNTLASNGVQYTHYNNYLIFKQSFFHLIQNKDLYQLYPQEYLDYYKYSPTFSVLFFPLAYLPDPIGLFIWNLLNALVLFFAIWKLPMQTDKTRILMLGFIIIELMTSLRNSQSNGLIVGLIIYAFVLLENKHFALASLFIVLTIFIKLFGLVALSLFIFYPNKVRNMIYTIGWGLLLAFLPLIAISFSQLTHLYTSWLNLLHNDHDESYGLSVAGWLHGWFGVDAKNAVVLLGAIIFCLPLLRYKLFDELKFRLLFLSSIMIWIVIFNHKAESPTFIIAIAGVSIWYFYQSAKIENTILLVLAFILTVLSPTDLFPRSIRDLYVIPYVLKAVPCIFIWFKISYDLLFYKQENGTLSGTLTGN